MPDEPPQREFKYEVITTGLLAWEHEISGIKMPFFQPLLQSFKMTVDRSANLGVMPAIISLLARRDQLFVTNAAFRVTGKGDMSIKELLGFKFTPEIQEELNKQLAEYDNLNDEDSDRFREILGIEFIRFLLKTNEGMRQSMEAILYSMIIDTWTAFECFTADAWVLTVNNAPKEVSKRVAGSKFLKKADDITPKVLHNLEYDIHSNFGKFLIDTRRVSFQSLGDIINSYSVLLDSNEYKVGAEIFDRIAGGYIHALAAIRNLLAHKSGRVDDEFVEKAQRFAELRGFVRDDQLLLDGEIVNKARNAAVLVVIDLIKKLDGIFSIQTPP